VRLTKTKALPASGGEGGPDDREENIGSHPDPWDRVSELSP